MNSPVEKIYVYKVVADTGGAPCVCKGLLSLAICKPQIRKSAKIGALIFGFGGKDYGERLIYIARVTGKCEGQDYYRLKQYARRPDCIYKPQQGQAVRKASARYHVNSDERRKDVGLHFEKAFVLLSKDFRYLGCMGTDDYKLHYPNLRTLVEKLRQGSRVNHPLELRSELLELKAKTWKSMKVGTPTERNTKRLCNT